MGPPRGDGALEISTRLVAGGDRSSACSAPPDNYLLLRNRLVNVQPGDEVLGVVTKRLGPEFARVCIGAATTSMLPTLAFNAATKRNRPSLEAGDMVFCWVEEIRAGEIVLSCLDAKCPKAWSTGESYYGVLPPGGYMLNWDVVAEELRGAAARALKRSLEETEGEGEAAEGGGEEQGECGVPGESETGGGAKRRKTETSSDSRSTPGARPKNHLTAVLNKLGKSFAFESAVGKNNRIYVRGPTPRDTLLLGQLLERVADPTLSDAMVEVLVARFRDEHGTSASRGGRRGKR